MGSAWDHLEAVLAASYRRELDHEENIWRSLPFLAATLAVELTALYQVVARLSDVPAGARISALVLLAAAVLFTAGAVVFAILMIPRTGFRYIATDVDLFRYGEMLEGNERELSEDQAPLGFDAVRELKESLAEQYAVATGRNRSMNDRRSQLRRVAGLCTLIAVFLTLLLVVLVFWHYVTDMIGGAPHGRV